MKNEVAIIEKGGQGVIRAELAERVRGYAGKSKANATKLAYSSDWRRFTEWCETEHLAPLPATPATVAAHLSWLGDQGYKVATIERALVAVSRAHFTAQLDSPRAAFIVRETMEGLRRTLGVAQTKKQPLMPEHVKAAAKAQPNTLAGLRNRAVLLIGFAGAFRRSELAALTVADVSFVDDGALIKIGRSKTDQQGRGETLGIPKSEDEQTCPVRALRAWLDQTNTTEGALFRAIDKWGHVGEGHISGGDVGRIVKDAAKSLGLAAADFGGHSLRAGFVTAAFQAGASDPSIMATTRHKSVKVLHGYYREQDKLKDNAGKGLL